MVSRPLRHGGRPPFTLQMSQEPLSPEEAVLERAGLSRPSGRHAGPARPPDSGRRLLPAPPPQPHVQPPSRWAASAQRVPRGAALRECDQKKHVRTEKQTESLLCPLSRCPSGAPPPPGCPPGRKGPFRAAAPGPSSSITAERKGDGDSRDSPGLGMGPGCRPCRRGLALWPSGPGTALGHSQGVCTRGARHPT